MSPKKDASKGGGIERRRTKRLPILSTFSLFIVVPQKGFHRLMVHDVSELGLGFDADTEGEETDGFPLKEGENLEVRFYLNQSLYLPLAVRIARLETRNNIRRIGAELDSSYKSYNAFKSFVEMLDAIEGVGLIE